MTSIITNTAAMAALDTLRSINSNMEETQSHVSSGYRVETASDNAAYWSIATTMRSDNKALSTVQDALAFGAAKTDTAYTGLNSAIDVVTEIKAKLVAAREPGGAAPATRRAEHQLRLLDLARSQRTRPVQPGRENLVAVEQDRALLADPLFDQPLSQAETLPP